MDRLIRKYTLRLEGSSIDDIKVIGVGPKIDGLDIPFNTNTLNSPIIVCNICSEPDKYISIINNNKNKRYILRIARSINFSTFLNRVNADHYDIYNFRDKHNYVSFYKK